MKIPCERIKEIKLYYVRVKYIFYAFSLCMRYLEITEQLDGAVTKSFCALKSDNILFQLQKDHTHTHTHRSRTNYLKLENFAEQRNMVNVYK